MATAVPVQGREDVGIPSCDEVQHGRFHVVHFRLRVELEAVLPRRSLLELLEGAQHVRAVVRFRVISANLDAVTLDVEAISDSREIGL